MLLILVEKKEEKASGSADMLWVDGSGVDLLVPSRSLRTEKRSFEVFACRTVEEKCLVFADEIVCFTLFLSLT